MSLARVLYTVMHTRIDTVIGHLLDSGATGDIILGRQLTAVLGDHLPTFETAAAEAGLRVVDFEYDPTDPRLPCEPEALPLTILWRDKHGDVDGLYSIHHFMPHPSMG